MISLVYSMTINMAEVQAKGRFEFDIFCRCAQLQLKNTASSLVKDVSTMNIAFTFGFNGSVHSVTLWEHRSILRNSWAFLSLMS